MDDWLLSRGMMPWLSDCGCLRGSKSVRHHELTGIGLRTEIKIFRGLSWKGVSGASLCTHCAIVPRGVGNVGKLIS